MATSLKDESRKNWVNSGENASHEQIQLGCLLRIADATEIMAQRHTELISERDMYKRWHDTEQRRADAAVYRIRSLKGQITKLRKKLAAKGQGEGGE